MMRLLTVIELSPKRFSMTGSSFSHRPSSTVLVSPGVREGPWNVSLAHCRSIVLAFITMKSRVTLAGVHAVPREKIMRHPCAQFSRTLTQTLRKSHSCHKPTIIIIRKAQSVSHSEGRQGIKVNKHSPGLRRFRLWYCVAYRVRTVSQSQNTKEEQGKVCTYSLQ